MRKRIMVMAVSLILLTANGFAETEYLAWGERLNYQGFYVVQGLEFSAKKFHLRMIVVSDDSEGARYELVYQDSWAGRFKKGDRIKIGFRPSIGKDWQATFWKNSKDWVCCFAIFSGKRLGNAIPPK